MIEEYSMMAIDLDMSPIKRDILHNDFAKLIPLIGHTALVKPYLIRGKPIPPILNFLNSSSVLVLEFLLTSLP